MRGDIERIKKLKKIWIRTDEQILNNKITESYKIDHSDTITQIKRDSVKFAQKMDMID